MILKYFVCFSSRESRVELCLLKDNPVIYLKSIISTWKYIYDMEVYICISVQNYKRTAIYAFISNFQD